MITNLNKSSYNFGMQPMIIIIIIFFYKSMYYQELGSPYFYERLKFFELLLCLIKGS